MDRLIKSKIEELLCKEFYCSREELNGRANVYSVNPDARQPFIKILAYKNCVVVCTSKELHAGVRDILRGKTRDEIFELPLVYGQTIHFVPDTDHPGRGLMSLDYECECLFGGDILTLSGLTGFDNSLVFDGNGSTAAQAVCVARDGKEIVGVAGAAKSSVHGVWEIGVDVKEGYRNAGLATGLVRRLTGELLTRNVVPFYSASVTNVGSQMVASRSGFIPCWVDTFGTVLDGSSVYGELVERLSLKKL